MDFGMDTWGMFMQTGQIGYYLLSKAMMDNDLFDESDEIKKDELK